MPVFTSPALHQQHGTSPALHQQHGITSTRLMESEHFPGRLCLAVKNGFSGRSDASSAAFFCDPGNARRINFLLDCMGVGGVKQAFPSFHGALAGVWYFRRGGEWGNGKAGIRTNWRRAEQAADLSGKSALIYV